MKIFVYSDLEQEWKDVLREKIAKEHPIFFGKDMPEKEAMAQFQVAEAIMGNPPLHWWNPIPGNLRFWQLDSAGFDQYHSVVLPEKVQVSNMGDFFARPCAETMVAGVLAFYRGLHKLVLLQQTKTWKGKLLRPELGVLGNKKVIVLGAGSIGILVKQQLLGFGCEVKIAARSNSAADLLSKEDILRELPATDVVINTLPGTADRFVSETFIGAMKQGALYASVGRGNTTDEAALMKALRDGKLAGAILDVTETEPIPAGSPLWEMEQVILTQHTGGGQAGEDKGKTAKFLANFHRLVAGERTEDQVQLTKGY